MRLLDCRPKDKGGRLQRREIVWTVTSGGADCSSRCAPCATGTPGYSKVCLRQKR